MLWWVRQCFSQWVCTSTVLRATQVIANHRRRQTFVGEHAVFDGVIQLDQTRALVHVDASSGM